jgi:peptidyl-prolyl cis-trans isomerase A (cyclophilin A)
VDDIAARLMSDNRQVAWVAARLLAGAGPAAKSAIPHLENAVAGKDPRLANAASSALRAIDVAAAEEKTRALLKPAAAQLRAPDTFRVTFHTSKGEVVVDVHRDWAPKGADRFYNLVKLGFFDDTRFFRVLPGFVAQFGLNGDPKVNSAWRSATIGDDPPKKSNAKGTLCFATAGPDTRTTQLFFNLGNNARLDKNFTPFGEVVEGAAVLEKIHAGDRDAPDQEMIQHEGNAYLDRAFPKLDRIERVVLEEKR